MRAHAGLVDHDQVLRAQWVAHTALLVGAEQAQELPGVQRVEPVLHEHLRGNVRSRHTEDPAADLLLPHVGQRADRAGLPGTGRADQHVAAPPGRQDLQHRVALVGRRARRPAAPPRPAPAPARTARRRRWRGRARRWPLRSPAARWWRTPRRCASGSGSARPGGAARPARSRRRGPTASRPRTGRPRRSTSAARSCGASVTAGVRTCSSAIAAARFPTSQVA